MYDIVTFTLLLQREFVFEADEPRFRHQAMEGAGKGGEANPTTQTRDGSLWMSTSVAMTVSCRSPYSPQLIRKLRLKHR